MARTNYLHINPKGAPPREVATVLNDMRNGLINVVDEISIPMSQAEGLVPFDDNLVHFDSGIFLAPKNENARTMLPRLYVAEVKDGAYDLFLEADTGSQDVSFLQGSVDTFTLNATPNALANYTSLIEAGSMVGQGDETAGTITIPDNGVYRIEVNVMLTQGNNTVGESIVLDLNVNAAVENIDVFDIGNISTKLRSLKATLTRPLVASWNLSLGLWATAGLGTFSSPQVYFEISKVFDGFTPATGDAEFLVLAIG